MKVKNKYNSYYGTVNYCNTTLIHIFSLELNITIKNCIHIDLGVVGKNMLCILCKWKNTDWI